MQGERAKRQGQRGGPAGRIRRSEVEPHEDYGFFGPGSVAWKVWGYPTAPIVGFQRAIVVEPLDPPLVAALDATQDLYKRPQTRYDRTLRYFQMVVFAGSRVVSKTADVLVKVHSKAIGKLPYEEGTYDANDPDSQRWTHLVVWHSVLYCYEKYGPGKLTLAEEAEYWESCAVAAELQTCSSDDVPRTREGIRQYFAAMRPKLKASPIALQAMLHLLQTEMVVPPQMPWLPRQLALAAAKSLRVATLATMPRWMREMAGLRQSRMLDVLIVPVMRVAFAVLHRRPQLELKLMGALTPSAVKVIAPVKLGIAPRTEEVLTPAEARERYGYAPPAEAHLEWRKRQAARVFGEGGAASDDGLIESQELLGPLG
ncbi:oxygenase MpaB family protein [Streptomyces coeruleorubidus]|uniref:oxygenase MpaB family protein n=1 Tax=Streptomyces coeruleorubidus TaxID=116188 RepID=UPI0033A9E9A0